VESIIVKADQIYILSHHEKIKQIYKLKIYYWQNKFFEQDYISLQQKWEESRDILNGPALWWHSIALNSYLLNV